MNKKINIPIWGVVIIGIFILGVSSAAIYFGMRKPKTTQQIQNSQQQESTIYYEETILQKMIELSDECDKLAISSEMNEEQIRNMLVLNEDILVMSMVSSKTKMVDFSKKVKVFLMNNPNHKTILAIKNTLNENKELALNNDYSVLEKELNIEIEEETKNESEVIDQEKATNTARLVEETLEFKNEGQYYEFQGQESYAYIDKYTGQIILYRKSVAQTDALELNKDDLENAQKIAEPMIEKLGYKNMVCKNFSINMGEIILDYYPIINDSLYISRKVSIGIYDNKVTMINSKYNESDFNNENVQIDLQKIQEKYKDAKIISAINCVINFDNAEKNAIEVCIMIEEQEYICYLDNTNLKELKILKVYNDKQGRYVV